MAHLSNNSYNIVFKVTYIYDDVELNKCVTLVQLCKSFHDVVIYLEQIENELEIQENAFYKCRSNIRIKIVPDLISDKKYVQLFNS